MNFEKFRDKLENQLKSFVEIELQEFVFAPYSMGYGHVAYRIRGRIHKFEFDPRDNILYWYVGQAHQKYSNAELKEFRRYNGLAIPAEDLMIELNSNRA